MDQQHPLVQERPEGPSQYRPAFAVGESANAEPEHSDLVDILCDTVTMAFARGREAGEAWVDAHVEPGN